MLHRQIRAALVFAVLSVGPACSEPEEEACRADPGLEDESKVVKCVVDDRCVGLQALPYCPASPNDAASLCTLFAGGGFPVTRTACGQDVVVSWSGFTKGLLCLYNSQGALVGTLSGTDSPSYCRRFGSWTWGVEIPAACQRPMAANLCAAAQP
jgi:hypothetical protein